MRTFLVLLNKELRAFFLSPVAWVVLALYMVTCAVSFSFSINSLRTNSDYSIVQWAFFPPWHMIYLFIPFPLITMRLFAEEQKMGTLESLMTAPVRTWQVLLAKYGASVIFYTILWLPMLANLAVLHWTVKGNVDIPRGALIGSYTIVILSGLFHLALGCLASALTKNQIIAAVMGFALILVHYLIGTFLLYLTKDDPGLMRDLIDYSVTERHFHYFSQGLLDTRPAVYYLSFTVLVLAITHHVLEYRRWRS